MKAIAITPGSPGAHLTERPEPQISADDEIKLKILQVGICGTDREEVEGGRADPPSGSGELVIGHENFGRVVEVGSAVKAVKPGDYAMFTVRRDCEPCICGSHNDMCMRGAYTERGIKGLDGYQVEYAVDKERYVIAIPESIKHLGVLAEPMSVSEKAINQAVRVQCARLPGISEDTWLAGKKVLVAGLGPIGLLAAFILKLRGAEVTGLDIVDEDTLRPSLLRAIGGTYVDGRHIKTLDLDDHLGQIDLIFEATGVPSLEFELIDALGINGIYVLTGIPSGKRPLNIVGAPLLLQMVLKNQVMMGSVNAGLDDFHTGIRELEEAYQKFPDAIDKVVTARIPVADFQKAFSRHDANDIKVVIEWEAP
jgi:threonine dehydrogenase-like Zn-dependent dehydrogenase